MKNKFIKRLVAALILILLGYIVFNSICNESELTKYGVKTTAEIIEIHGGNKGERNIKFKFLVDDIVFESIDQVPFLTLLPCERKNDNCVGQTIEIIYSYRNPEINKILIDITSKNTK